MIRYLHLSALLLPLLFSSTSSAFDLLSNNGFDVSGLYLNQSGGGDTFTVMPRFNLYLHQKQNLRFDLQAGATFYKDSVTDKTFGIGSLRLNTSYKFQDSPYSLALPLGLQVWEGEGITGDIELRGARHIQEWIPFLSEVHLGVGYISYDDGVTSITAGVTKWF